MKNLFWLIAGIVAGTAAAVIVARNPRGRVLFDSVDQRSREFTAAVVGGYRDREAELRAAVDNVLDDAEEGFDDVERALDGEKRETRSE